MQLLFLTFSLVLTHHLTGAARPEKCASRCDVSLCPSLRCPGGFVLDRCNCCQVCLSRENEPCGRKDDASCGEGMECRPLVPAAGKRRGGPGSGKGVCRCKTEQQVCGTDGRSYSNVCRLKAASRKAQQKGRPEVRQAHKGACRPPGAAKSCNSECSLHHCCEGEEIQYTSVLDSRHPAVYFRYTVHSF